jgi:hypothetical protein
MTFCIIVARYNEDIEWTKQFPNVIVYNKGNKLDDDYNAIVLPNVGREGHTYYKYICDNYENLADHTIFLQGTPFDHSPNIIHNLTYLINNTDFSIDFLFLSEDIHHSSLDVQCENYYVVCNNIHKTWERVFGLKPVNQECIFGAGAQFIVSKKNILKKPKEFYENIVKMLDYDINPVEGYDIERLHNYIFN